VRKKVSRKKVSDLFLAANNTDSGKWWAKPTLQAGNLPNIGDKTNDNSIAERTGP